MRKSLFVITLLTASFMFPSWGMAALRGSYFCCTQMSAAAQASIPGAGTPAPSAPHAPAQAAPAGHVDGRGPAAQPDPHTGHGGHGAAQGPAAQAGPHTGHGAAQAQAQAQAQAPSETPTAPADAAQDTGLPCGLLSCALAPAAAFPDAYSPALPSLQGASSHVAPDAALPAPTARLLFRPPRA